MRLLEMGGTDIIVPGELLMVKEFKDLWKEDKSKNKEKVKAQLAYIYFFCDWESPYAKHLELERQEKIISDLELKKDLVTTAKVKAAIDKYEELMMTTSMLLLKDAEVAVQKLRLYFREVDLTERDDRTGKPIFTAKDLTMNLKSVGDVIKGLKKLKEEVKKEQMDNSSIKGGGRVGDFEDPE
jgi:hypothetical protein